MTPHQCPNLNTQWLVPEGAGKLLGSVYGLYMITQHSCGGIDCSMDLALKVSEIPPHW